MNQTKALRDLLELVKDESHALCFQTFSQYRQALAGEIRRQIIKVVAATEYADPWDKAPKWATHRLQDWTGDWCFVEVHAPGIYTERVEGMYVDGKPVIGRMFTDCNMVAGTLQARPLPEPLA
ncbi:hypothetical protein ACU7AI_27125 [Pseudomonas aeruginosa]